MAIFSEGGWTSPDFAIGISCICLAVLCTVLNSLVLLHNYHKNKSVARSLYLCLSATDLVTAWVLLVPYSIIILRKEEIECIDNEETPCHKNEDTIYNEEVNFSDKLLSLLCQTMTAAPSHITAALAITRYFQIRYPFRSLKTKMVLVAVFVSSIWQPAVVICYFLSPNKFIKIKTHIAVIGCEDHPRLFNVKMHWKIYSAISFVPTTVLQFLSIVFSLLTIYELVKSYLNPIGEAPRRRKTKSTVRILVTNIGSILSLLCYTILVTGEYKKNKDVNKKYIMEQAIRLLMGTQFLPAIVSAINPVIYMTFANGCSLKVRPE